MENFKYAVNQKVWTPVKIKVDQFNTCSICEGKGMLPFNIEEDDFDDIVECSNEIQYVTCWACDGLKELNCYEIIYEPKEVIINKEFMTMEITITQDNYNFTSNKFYYCEECIEKINENLMFEFETTCREKCSDLNTLKF